MKIISHRGAAGLAPENTLAGIDKAIETGVDYIEVDMRPTKDKHLVLLHDQSLYRINGTLNRADDLTLKEISTTRTHSGHPIPTLQEALEHSGDTPLFIDCKGKDWPEVLAKLLKKHNGPPPSVICPNQNQLFQFKQLMPSLDTYLSNRTNPLNAMYAAKTLGFNGVSLNFWTLNPISYFYAKRYNLKIMAYTVNRTLLARFIHFLYPKALIITDFPDKLAKLSIKRSKK